MNEINVPLEPPVSPDIEEKRIWIGNLDNKITEYSLLKIIQKYGKIVKFDFLFHKKGQFAGTPRGYCFVTYEKVSEAELAIKSLNGKMALSRKISARWAHQALDNRLDMNSQSKQTSHQPSISDSATRDPRAISKTITAIEQKLRKMENSKGWKLTTPTKNSIHQKPYERKK